MQHVRDSIWLVMVVIVASCRGDASLEYEPIGRITPASVSDADAWRLFDRSISSSFSPTEKPLAIEFDSAQTVNAIKVFGPAPFTLAVRGRDGSALGFAVVDLANLSAGWHVFAATTARPTSGVELQFTPTGPAASVPEIELWGSSEPAPRTPDLAGTTVPGFKRFNASVGKDEVAPGQCARFSVSMPQPPALFRRAHLVVEPTGAFRSFVLQRTINGQARYGGTWLSGSSTSPFVDEIDPAVLSVGPNEIELCAPSDATNNVTLANVRIVAEIDRGSSLVTKASLGDRDANALLDVDTTTHVDVATGEQLTLELERLIAPDAIVLSPQVDVAPKLECIDGAGRTRPIATRLLTRAESSVVELQGAALQCRQIGVKFASALELAGVDVIGSGAAERVDWPRIIVTSKPEHFETRAWVGGFVARPAAMSGAVRVLLDNRAPDSVSGNFGSLLARDDATSSSWAVAIVAELPDGSRRSELVTLDTNRRSDLATIAPAIAHSVGTEHAATNRPAASREGDVVSAIAPTAAASQIRLASRVGLDIPAGAMAKPTTITVRHLGVSVLPPLDPGMINVTAPHGQGYEFLPHGQKFKRAVEVVIPYDPSLLPEGMTADDVYTFYYDQVDQRWKKLTRKAIDTGERLTRSSTDHFTIMIDAVLAVPKNTAPLSFDPTSMSSISAASPSAGIDIVEAPTANANGSAKMSLPIQIPSSRGAFSPSLALSHDSSAGNGWLGLHWDLGMPRVEIDTRWGVPTYADGDAPRYVLDGAELVPTDETPEGPTCENAKRYRTRIEGTFAHILRCGSGPTAYRWEVRDRDGTVFVYGTDGASDHNPTVAGYTGVHGTGRWNLARVVDTHGNTTRFHYRADEISDTPEPSIALYPASIEYTQHASLPASQYSIEFDVDDGSRPDQIVSARMGWKAVTRRLLRSVRVMFRGAVVRQYVLTYAHGQFDKSVLAGVKLYGAGGCAAGTNAFVAPSCPGASFLAEHSFDYFREEEGFAPAQAWRVDGDPDADRATLGKGASSSVSGSAGVSVGSGDVSGRLGVNGSTGGRSELVGMYDVNSDGLPDQLFDARTPAEPDRFIVIYNQSRPGLDPAADALFAPTLANVSGLPALGAEHQSSWGVSLSGNAQVAQASAGFSSSTSRARRIFADIDGDGYLDLLRTDGPSVLGQRCATGTCFTPTSFGATSSIDPRADSVLQGLEHDIKARLPVGDPVVQWVAPFDGTITLAGSVRKASAGGSDGVIVDAYHNDTLLDSLAVGANDAATHSFPATSTLAVEAGEAIYLRVRTGSDDAIAPDGTLQDLVDGGLDIRYVHACTQLGCNDVTDPLGPREPTGRPVFAFDSQTDFRVAGMPAPLVMMAGGELRLQAMLVKQPALADLRFCVQRFGSPHQLVNKRLDRPCSASDADVVNVSGTFALDAAAAISQPLDLTIPIEAGQLVMVRVESDLSFDPNAVALQPLVPNTPLAHYTQVCIPDTNNTISCSTDPTTIASVPLSLSNFGPFVPVSTEPPGIPFLAPTDGVFEIEPLAAPSGPFLFAVRSDRQGVISLHDCMASSCGPFITVPPFTLSEGESVTFELVTDELFVPSSLAVSLGSLTYSAPLVRRPISSTPHESPFVGGYRGFRAAFWNEAVAFEPHRLLLDLATPFLLTPERAKEIALSITIPLPSFGGSPITDGVPAWIAPGSSAFVSATGLHASYIGLLNGADTRADVGGLFAKNYSRLSATKGFYISGGVALPVSGFSFSVSASSSWTDTTTDIMDMNADGVADVVTAHATTLGALSDAASGAGTAAFTAGDSLRHRDGHEYSVGFGGKAVIRRTRASGLPLDVGNSEGPDEGTFGLSAGRGLAISRAQVTKDLTDVNGDGMPDLVTRDGETIKVQLNLGSRFGALEPFGEVASALRVSQDGFESSVEDGVLSSVLNSTNNSMQHETTITTEETGGFDFIVVSCSHSSKHTAARTTRELSDINGDGLPDILFKKHGEAQLRVQLNRGGDFGPPTTWPTTDAWPVDLAAHFDDVASSILGKLADLAVTGPNVLGGTGSQESSSNGCSVSIPIVPGVVSVDFGLALSKDRDTYELALIDVDGDSTSDHVLRRGAHGGDPANVYVKRNLVTGRANLLKAVHRPLGGTIELDYELSANTQDMPESHHVLTRVEVDDGVDLGAAFASPNITSTISYEGGVFSREEKEFFGFHKVVTKRGDGATVESTYNNSSYALHGQLLSETLRDHDGRMFHQRLLTYAVLPVLGVGESVVGADPTCVSRLHPLLTRVGDACTPLFATVVREDDTRAEGGAETKTRTTHDLTRDRFGNILVSTDGGDDAIATDDLHIQADYQNDNTQWILGRPTSLQVRAGSATGTLLRSRAGAYDTRGKLIAAHVDTGNGIATTNLGYDTFGNLSHMETPPNEVGQRQSYDLVFDPEVATFPITVTDGFGYASTSEYDLRFGLATREVDTHGAQLRRVLDDFGRIVAVFGPYDTSLPGLSMEYHQLEHPARAVTVRRSSAPADYTGPMPAPTTSVAVVDGLGRSIETRKTAVVNGVFGMTTMSVVARDTVGRVTAAYQPFFTPGASTAFVAPQLTLATTSELDVLDRPIRTTYPDGAFETATFAIEDAPGGDRLFAMHTRDGNGNARESYLDYLGRTRTFIEHPTSTTSATARYEYLPTGELSRIVDAEGNVTDLAFDRRGLQTRLENPDAGLVENRYDLMGNKVAVVEPNHRALGTEVHYLYERDRLVRVDYPTKTDVAMTYGSPGAGFGGNRVIRIADESGTQEHTYGALGEVRRTIRQVDLHQEGSTPVTFDLKLTTDSLGRQLRIGYPDGEVVTNTYDAAGMLSQVGGQGTGWSRTYVSELQYDVFDNRTRARFGNGSVTTWAFEPTRVRLSTVTTTTATSAKIQDLHFTYDGVGNPLQIDNTLAQLTGGSGTMPGRSGLTMTYDGVDRLTRSVGQAQLSAQKTTAFDQQFVYSASHKLLQKQRVHIISNNSGIPQEPGSTNFASNYTYGQRPHLPSQIGQLAITYDASGNPTVRRQLDTGSQQTLIWDDANRLAEFSNNGGNQRNTYDALGNRVRRKSTQSETIFSSPYFDLENGTQGVKHIFAGQVRVASQLNRFASGTDPIAPDKRGTAYYFHSDQLQSTRVLTDDDGAVQESIEYFPDGETWIERGPKKPVTGYLFSGKPYDPDTGLLDFGQRYYEARTSMWFGVDPAFVKDPRGSTGAPAMLAVASYAANNPVKFFDPDGLQPKKYSIVIQDFTHKAKEEGTVGQALVDHITKTLKESFAPGGAGDQMLKDATGGKVKAKVTSTTKVGDTKNKGTTIILTDFESAKSVEETDKSGGADATTALGKVKTALAATDTIPGDKVVVAVNRIAKNIAKKKWKLDDPDDAAAIRDYIESAVIHEIGHNLGLCHEVPCGDEKNERPKGEWMHKNVTPGETRTWRKDDLKTMGKAIKARSQ